RPRHGGVRASSAGARAAQAETAPVVSSRRRPGRPSIRVRERHLRRSIARRSTAAVRDRVLSWRVPQQHQRVLARKARDGTELGRVAGRVWSEGRANPIDWEVRTPLAVFTTEDRASWHTESADWTAELRRSKNGRHWFLALFEAGAYRGRYDTSGWHAATERR